MASNQFELWELFLIPIYLGVALFIAYLIQSSNIQRDPRFKYFLMGFSVRILGGLAFAGLYLFYYKGGDTLAYFTSAVPYINLLFQNPTKGLEIYLSAYSKEMFSVFTQQTGFPLAYILVGSDTIAVVRLILPFTILGLKSYLLSSIVISSFSFIGPWRLFQTLCEIFPNHNRLAAIACFFIPSAVFWSSGISKDTFTYVSTCYFVHAIHTVLIQRKFSATKILFGVITLYVILTIKPYIFLVLTPAALILVLFSSMQRIRSAFLRYSIVPIVLVISVGAFVALLPLMSNMLGEYSMDNIIDKAIVTQEDLKREAYGENSFDIGTIDPSPLGIISKFPIALVSGLYRPTFFEVNNIVMLLSAIENTLLLLASLYAFVLRNPFKNIKRVFNEAFLSFCFIFVILFAFAIGLTTANFGALIRFKIPILPFLAISLLALIYRVKENRLLQTSR